MVEMVTVLENKIIIAGSGRAGTSFLAKLFTRLGFDTGMIPYKEHYSTKKRAGCELWLDYNNLDDLPSVIKAPIMSFKMKMVIDRLDVGCVLIPIRDIDIAAKSRIDVGLQWQEPSILANPELDDFSRTVLLNAAAIGFTLEACITTKTPFIIMKFPDFVMYEQYCYNCLLQLNLKIDRNLFSNVFRKTADPKSIKFKGDKGD